MKKKALFVLAIIMIAVLCTSAWFYGYYNRKSNDNIELDNEGNVLNYKYCERRAAEYIRIYFNPDYSLDKPFEDWELELHPVSKESYSL